MPTFADNVRASRTRVVPAACRVAAAAAAATLDGNATALADADAAFTDPVETGTGFTIGSVTRA